MNYLINDELIIINCINTIRKLLNLIKLLVSRMAEFFVKVVIIGDSNVGKTSLLT